MSVQTVTLAFTRAPGHWHRDEGTQRLTDRHLSVSFYIVGKLPSFLPGIPTLMKPLRTANAVCPRSFSQDVPRNRTPVVAILIQRLHQVHSTHGA